MPWSLRESFSCAKSAISSNTFLTENVIIKVEIANNPNSWLTAGWCHAVYNVPEIGSVESDSKNLSLNKAKLVNFPLLAPYQISIHTKPWIELTTVTIWEFQ